MSHLLDLIQKAEDLNDLWGEARNVEEARLLTVHTPPPEIGPRPDSGSREDQIAWHKAFRSRVDFNLHILDLAEAVPYVAELEDQRELLVKEIWDIVGRGTKPAGEGPGLCRCPVCGERGVSLPSREPKNHGSSSRAVCKGPENHLIEWLPWGG